MLSDFDAKAREMRGRFIAKASSRQARLQVIMSMLESSPPPDAMEELEQISHWLAGSAPTFGLKAIGVAADALENELVAQRSSGKVDRAALTASCNRLLETIQGSLQSPDDRLPDNG